MTWRTGLSETARKAKDKIRAGRTKMLEWEKGSLGFLGTDLKEIRGNMDHMISNGTGYNMGRLLATAAVASAIGAYTLAPRSTHEVVETGNIEHVAERIEPVNDEYIVKQGDNLWTIVESHADSNRREWNDQTVPEDLKSARGEKYIASLTDRIAEENSQIKGQEHLAIDNKKVVNGQTVQGADGIRGDVLKPGDTIGLSGYKTTTENLTVPVYGVDSDETGYNLGAAALTAVAAGLIGMGLGGGRAPTSPTGPSNPQEGSHKGKSRVKPRPRALVVGGPKELEEAVSLYANDMELSVDEIVERTGVQRQSLYDSIDNSSAMRRKEALRWDTLGRSMNTQAYKAQGHSARDIADMLGVSTSTVYRDLKREVPQNACSDLYSGLKLVA